MSSLAILLLTLFAGVSFVLALQAVLLSIFATKLNFFLKLATLFLTLILQLALVGAVTPELDTPLANAQLPVTLAILMWLIAIGVPWVIIRPKVQSLQT